MPVIYDRPTPVVLTWDWREQPDLDALTRILANHGVHLAKVETGSDEYAVVISADPLTAEEVEGVWRMRWRED
jgi:hypothetical protein